jgi:branched-chain amino acid aminotransferase
MLQQYTSHHFSINLKGAFIMTFEENIGKICIINGEILPPEGLNQYSDEKYKACYEVIRIINGIPLFYDEHYLRLKNSVQKTKNELDMSRKNLMENIQKVCELNDYTDCNVKVLVLLYEGEQNTLMFINKFYYPSTQEYNIGVKCCTLKLERNNPNIKMINTSYKEQIKRVTADRNVFEVILVNDSGKITEGGKSNVFFVKGNKIYTSPEEYVLKGVTRQHIIDVCNKLGYEVIETLIGVESLTDFDAAFITGTSINAMPVRVIDDYVLDSAGNAVTRQVMTGYESLVASYIENNLQ